MTFKKKLQMEHPESVSERFLGGCECCPHHYGYEEKYACADTDCEECWNREMPNTGLENVKEAFSKVGKAISKAISKASEDVYKEDMITDYNQGLNDAWEFLDRIEHAIKSSVLIEVFGYSNIGDILDHFKPQEALAKLKAYEDSKIEVGDVVDHDGLKSVVVRVVEDKVYTITSIGTTPSYTDINKLKKNRQAHRHQINLGTDRRVICEKSYLRQIELIMANGWKVI